MLRFQVKGSAREPYQVTASGKGADFAIYCSCPAGRRGGLFCKHAAALLLGDVSRLIQPSDDVSALARNAQGSEYPSLAMEHVPTDQKRPMIFGFSSLSEVEEAYRSSIEAKGWKLARRTSSDHGDEEFLELFGKTPTGRWRKQPSISISYHSTAFDVIEEADGTLTYTNPRPRGRPWCVRHDGPTKTWSSLAGALPAFFSAIGIEA